MLVSGTVNYFFGMINALQVFVMMPLFLVTLPANAAAFFSQLMAFSAFEFFDTKPFLNWMF